MKEKKYITIPSMSGTVGDASAVITNATFELKEDGSKRYPDPDFGIFLADEIYLKKKIFADKVGFFRKRQFCPSCNKELNPDEQSAKTFEFETKCTKFDPYMVKITIPAVECPRCKRVCGIDTDGNVARQLSDAIIKAFESEQIKPK